MTTREQWLASLSQTARAARTNARSSASSGRKRASPPVVLVAPGNRALRTDTPTSLVLSGSTLNLAFAYLLSELRLPGAAAAFASASVLRGRPHVPTETPLKAARPDQTTHRTIVSSAAPHAIEPASASSSPSWRSPDVSSPAKMKDAPGNKDDFASRICGAVAGNTWIVMSRRSRRSLLLV